MWALNGFFCAETSKLCECVSRVLLHLCLCVECDDIGTSGHHVDNWDMFNQVKRLHWRAPSFYNMQYSTSPTSISNQKYYNKWQSLDLPSSQTSVSILTASALLWRCCKFCPPDGCLQQLICCFSAIGCTPKNGASRTCEPPNKPGVDSTPSSRSIISDEDSESDDFFKCWPTMSLDTNNIKRKKLIKLTY